MKPRGFRRAAAAVCITVTSCAGEATIAGEVRDDRIVLEQPTGPAMIWLELTNVGSESCELLAVQTALPPNELPTHDGRVAVALTGTEDLPYPLGAYVEIDGVPFSGEETATGVTNAVLPPGKSARMQIALNSTPDRDERVILCNGPGEYEAGRYAMLRFDR